MIISILITTPFQRVWGTHSFEIEKQPNAKLVYARVFTYLALLLAFASLAIGIFIKDVIGVIAPPAYAAAASIVPLVLLGYAFLGLNNAAAIGIMIRNKTKYIAFIQIPVVALNAILNLLLIPYYNIRGAALATMISFGVMLFITLTVSQKLYPIAYEYRRLAMVIGATIVLFMLAKLVSGPWHLLLLYHGILLAALPLCLYALKFFTREEMDGFRTYMEKICPSLRKSAA
jgi:O-antigen/teichoic acid export membrane protein